ncbi:MAG: hypothetical protein GY798_19040, partial [Hyphomicrobiales bacterium]|nr:hypothetical protein [Hyphomicrobiales bacterium]
MVRKALSYAAGVGTVVFCLPLVAWTAGPSYGQSDDEPPSVVSETRDIGDWLLSCRAVADNRQCALSQRLTQNETGTVVFVWTIARDPEGKIVSIWEMP